MCARLLFLSLPALPKPPTSLVTSAVTANSVKVSWNPGTVDPVDFYIIQYKPKFASGVTYDEIADITDTEYTVVGLNAYTQYEIRVVAVNNIGRGIASSPVGVTTGELGLYLKTFCSFCFFHFLSCRFLLVAKEKCASSCWRIELFFSHCELLTHCAGQTSVSFSTYTYFW